MSGGKKERITITVDPDAARRIADQHGLALLRERARSADPDRVARMRRHVNLQLAEQGFLAAPGE